MATLFVDKLDPQSGTALEIGSSGDTISIPSGATLDATGATITGALTMTPAFQATKRDTSHQTFSTTPTKITFSNEDFDTDNMFASDRFTPTTAGKYFLYFQVLGQPNAVNSEDAYLKLYKNGSAIGNYASDSQFANVDQFQNGQNNSLSGSFTDTANGTGDYYEIYAYYSESFTVTDAAFGGYKLIGV